MYYLINTFTGTIVSIHHTIEDANKAAAKLQLDVKRTYGPKSYIPTKIVEASPREEYCRRKGLVT